MQITHAVITAAAPDQSTLPLQRLVDQQGEEKTALQLIVEEVVDAGIEHIGVVICPSRREAFEQAAGEHAGRLSFIEQDHPRGYGDALLRARDFVGRRAFLHLVGDHLYVSESDHGCARQLVDFATAEKCAVSAVQPTRESMLPYFGTIGGRPVPNRSKVYEITQVVEKPTATQAEQKLIVAGLRAGHYLCLFGMHVLTPTVMDLLTEAAESEAGPATLSPALSALAERERYLALEIEGNRYNIGVKYGLLNAQLAVALSGRDRERILGDLVELLAARR